MVNAAWNLVNFRAGLIVALLAQTFDVVAALNSQFSEADLVRGGRRGLVVPAEDSRALAEAVAWLWGHSAEAAEMGDRVRRLAVGWHAWSVRVRQTEQAIVAAARGAGRGTPETSSP